MKAGLHPRLLTLGLLAIIGWLAPPAAAFDCTRKSTQAEQVLCSSPELERVVGNIWSTIHLLSNFLDGSASAELVSEQNRWLDQRAQTCSSAGSPAATLACLQPALLDRSWDLWKRYEKFAAGHGRGSSPIDVGGLPLAILSSDGCGGDVYLADAVIVRCVQSIDPLARYRDREIDAFLFVANSGGAGYVCENFPVYLAAVHPNKQVDIVGIPANFGGPRGDACPPQVTRTATGFELVFPAQPFADGGRFTWTLLHGLSAREVLRFAPKPGSTMRGTVDSPGTPLMQIEEFHTELRKFANATRRDFATLAEAFSSDVRGGGFETAEARNAVVFVSCPMPGPPGHCYGQQRPRVVYDAAIDRMFFAVVDKDLNSTCGENLGGTFFPPRAEWSAAASLALSRSFCEER